MFGLEESLGWAARGGGGAAGAEVDVAGRGSEHTAAPPPSAAPPPASSATGAPTARSSTSSDRASGVPILSFACCNYFAVLPESVRRFPRHVWAAAYNRTVSPNGACDSRPDGVAVHAGPGGTTGEGRAEGDPTGQTVAGAFESLAHAVWGGLGAHYSGPMGADALRRLPTPVSATAET